MELMSKPSGATHTPTRSSGIRGQAHHTFAEPGSRQRAQHAHHHDVFKGTKSISASSVHEYHQKTPVNRTSPKHTRSQYPHSRTFYTASLAYRHIPCACHHIWSTTRIISCSLSRGRCSSSRGTQETRKRVPLLINPVDLRSYRSGLEHKRRKIRRQSLTQPNGTRRLGSSR